VVENQPSIQKPKLNFPTKEKLKNSENARYTIPVKKVKTDFKAAADTEKILKLLFKQPVQGILVEDLFVNCPNLHKRFFGKYVSEIIKDMKGVIQVRTMLSFWVFLLLISQSLTSR
jgi:hypothetical protein